MARDKTGSIQTTRHGAYRASVYLGLDPLTKKRRYLWGKARREYADALRDLGYLLDKAAEEQPSGENVSVRYLLGRYMEIVDIARSTLKTYRGYVNRTILPALGDSPAHKVRASTLEQFYARLRVCSELCDGRLHGKTVTKVRRWKDREHPYGGTHRCNPMAANTIHQINGIISGAYAMGMRWEWVTRNPASDAKLPKVRRREPEPPRSDDVAQLINHVWTELPDLAVYLWVAVVTGSRRGELCALRWHHLDLDTEEPSAAIARSYGVIDGEGEEKETKTYQGRRMAIDTVTADVLRSHRLRCQNRLGSVGASWSDQLYLFSPDGGYTPWNPDWVTRKVGELAKDAGAQVNIRSLRHYNATQLLTGGVDLRTTAGRLGHVDGGAITLRVYAHKTRPSDQRAASVARGDLAAPAEVPDVVAAPVDQILPRSLNDHEGAPHEQLASILRDAIADGRLKPRQAVPSLSSLAGHYGLSTATAHRAVRTLADEGRVTVRRGARTIVAPPV